jgi:hypothetical protein
MQHALPIEKMRTMTRGASRVFGVAFLFAVTWAYSGCGTSSPPDCSVNDFCGACAGCVSHCRCGSNGACPFTQVCEGAVCPNSCASGEVCGAQPGGSVGEFMCSPLCTPGVMDGGQGSCPAGMTCETVCP